MIVNKQLTNDPYISVVVHSLSLLVNCFVDFSFRLVRFPAPYYADSTP